MSFLLLKVLKQKIEFLILSQSQDSLRPQVNYKNKSGANLAVFGKKGVNTHARWYNKKHLYFLGL